MRLRLVVNVSNDPAMTPAEAGRIARGIAADYGVMVDVEQVTRPASFAEPETVTLVETVEP